MQTKDSATKIEEAMEWAETRLLASGRPFSAFDVGLLAAGKVASEDPEEWAVFRLATALEAYVGIAQRRLARAVRLPDDRQGLLAFPEYSRIPQLIEVEGGVVDINESTLEQYRESTQALASRIKSYDYPRRSNEKLKRDKEELAQRRRLDKNVAPLMAGNPEMKVGAAIKMLLESPMVQKGRKAIKARWDRKKART